MKKDSNVRNTPSLHLLCFSLQFFRFLSHIRFFRYFSLLIRKRAIDSRKCFTEDEVCESANEMVTLFLKIVAGNVHPQCSFTVFMFILQGSIKSSIPDSAPGDSMN